MNVNLTAREKEVVVWYVGHELGAKQVAVRMGISESAVKKLIGSVYRKLGIDGFKDRTIQRIRLTKWAIRTGLIDAEDNDVVYVWSEEKAMRCVPKKDVFESVS